MQGLGFRVCRLPREGMRLKTRITFKLRGFKAKVVGRRGGGIGDFRLGLV